MFSSRCSVPMLVVVLVAFHASASAVEWRLLSESPDGSVLRIEVRIPPPLRMEKDLDGIAFSRFLLEDAKSTGSPGSPELLVASQLVALPPGGEPTLSILEQDTDELGTVRLLPRQFHGISYDVGGSPDDPSSGWPEEWMAYDPAAYTAEGANNIAAALGTVGNMRDVRAVAIDVWPLLYDPTTSRLRVVRRLLLELRLSSPRGGSPERLQPPQQHVPWQRIYDQLFLNAGRVRSWQRAPERVARLGKPLASGMLRPGLLAEDEWKLRVRSTGPLRVPAANLLGAGFPDGTPIDQLRLVLKRFDATAPLEPRIVEIPIHIEDDGDGVFESGDSFLFWAEQPRDDATAGERAARYSFTNVYWLSVAATGVPARMPVRPPLLGPSPGPARFDQDVVFEEDRVLNQWVYGSDEELYFLLDRARLGLEAVQELSVPGRATDSALEICVDTQQDWLNRPFTVEAAFPSGQRLVLGTSNGVPALDTAPPHVVVCGQVPAPQVEPGNVRVILTALQSDDHAFEDFTPFVDNIRLRYAAEYRVTADDLRCTSGAASGPTAFTITGCSGAPLAAFDVTDPKSPALFDLTGALTSGTLTLTDDVGAPRRYRIVANAAIPALAATDLERDTPDPMLDELADPGQRFDVLVISHDDFAQDAKLLEWKAYREGQGYRVRIARTSDVYDAFNGGLLHYDPIYNFVRSAYQNWGIGYVLLVGDGSEDAAGLWPTSGRNFVPSPMAYFLVTASAGGGNEYRNDINERYYAKMNGPSDQWPDLLIGRFPVGTSQELRNIVDKTLLYEQPADADDGKWRKRVLLFSDDEWVRRQTPTGIVHRRGCQEWDFFFSIRCTCETVRNAFPGDLSCVPFYLHEWSNRQAASVPEHAPFAFNPGATPCSKPGQSCGGAGYLAPHRGTSEIFFYEGQVARALADSVGDGVLFFALQSHANRAIVTDEQFVRREPNPSAPFVPDFHNQGKPFVFFGFGCHLNEFGVPGENANGEIVGDALGEVYLTVAQRGAVASYASTGFEFLDQNNDFHELMWRAIFEKRYTRTLGNMSVFSDTLAADWLLSALLQVSEISNGRVAIIDRFALLGDPLLQLDAGVPRFEVTGLDNGFFLDDGRIGAYNPIEPVHFTMRVSDEQGIDSLWVKRRYVDGPDSLIANVRVTATVDTAQQVKAKRGYELQFDVFFDSCDFDLVVGARDLSGRVSEFVGRGQSERFLYANGLEVEEGNLVDARASFRYVIQNCIPDPTVPNLVVLLDDQPVPDLQISPADSLSWNVDFAWNVAPGDHRLQFQIAGGDSSSVNLVVQGVLGLHDVLAFPNPFADKTHFFFNLDAEIAGGHLRIMDLNGRTVRQFDLGGAGVLQDLLPPPPSKPGGTTMAMNFVAWDGTDSAGDRVANGVYLYEVLISDASGREIRKRDKVVLMH